jgi:transposase
MFAMEQYFPDFSEILGFDDEMYEKYISDVQRRIALAKVDRRKRVVTVSTVTTEAETREQFDKFKERVNQIKNSNEKDDNKTELDLSSVDIDGSHTPALRGGEEVAYQGRKKKKTTNSLYLADRQGLPLALSSPVAGNHHDLYNIEIALNDMFGTLSKAGILLDGLFANADSGFDAKNFREACLEKGIFPNVAFNYRNGNNNDEIYLLDELLYEERYSIERTNAWLDSYRSVLNRFDTTTASWESFNYIAFIVILLKKINKNKKSK